MRTLGVIVLNMGGPDSLDAVRPFLENLFLDREIISFGPLERARRPLARFIARRRASKVRANYAAIGGRSPIAELSRLQAGALEDLLRARLQGRARVRVAPGFSYWHPFLRETMEDFARDGVDDVLLLPLYPHYSKTTTGSCFKTFRDLRRGGLLRGAGVAAVKSYHDHPRYLAALSTRIDEGLATFPAGVRETVQLLFSAHGTPVKLVTEGDPYAAQIRATVEGVMALRGHDRPHHLSFQSKVGPVRWLEPDTVSTTASLGAAGVRALLVVPVSFVTDHIETLHELDIELRHAAARAGIAHFGVMPALNTAPSYIEALADAGLRRLRNRYPVEPHE